MTEHVCWVGALSLSCVPSHQGFLRGVGGRMPLVTGLGALSLRFRSEGFPLVQISPQRRYNLHLKFFMWFVLR